MEQASSNQGDSTSGPSNAQEGRNQHPRGTTEAEDRMDLDEETPANNHDAGQNSQFKGARSATWQETMDIPHRELRVPNTKLPPLGKIINASGNTRPTSPPVSFTDDNHDADVDGTDDPGAYEPLSANFNYTNDEYDDPLATRAEVQELREAIRDDINSGLNRILDEMLNLQHSGTPAPTSREVPRRKRISTNPVRRDAAKNKRLKRVRDHLATLIGQNRAFTPSVTAEESATFKNIWDATQGNPPYPCCTVQTFRIDILGTPKNPWNRSASLVFYESFVPEAERSRAMLLQVTADFFTRVKTITAEYKKKADDGARRIAQRDARRKGRKYDLFQRRLTVAQTVPQFNQHISILERLTIAGMSSDESDTEHIVSDPTLAGQQPRYEVKQPLWRHPRLFEWLRVFDKFHIAGRRTSGTSAGEWPHDRFRNARVSKFSANPNFIPDLPINAYNEDWLDTRHDIDLMIRPTEEEYDFTHPDVIHAVG